MNAALVALLLPAAGSTPRNVPRAEILSAMRTCEGYDPTATTNGARFQAEVLLRLARKAPDGPSAFPGPRRVVLGLSGNDRTSRRKGAGLHAPGL